MPLFDVKKSEEEVLEFWERNQIFTRSLEKTKRGTPFVFFEGPPTANGKPGIHHLLGRAFKDLFCRYQTMRGRFVGRRAGWDTHGLPVEIEVEKELGLKNKKDIETYGIAAFNAKAKESVWKYRKEWERMTKRMGFWIDLEHPYVTYDSSYVETLWWILRKFWDRKLLYEGHKVVPYCTRCGTPLSFHEVAQGYKETTDTSVFVKFKILPGQRIPTESGQEWISTDHTYILAWTTTPWTLPGNVALAVGSDIHYEIVSFNDEQFIIAADRLSLLEGAVTHASPEGKHLVGLEYEPLFDVPSLKSPNSYRIYPAKFVTTTEGTGVVHTAVMYGENDYALGMEVGLPARHTVDEQGRFTADVPELTGNYVKDPETERLILGHLRDKNLLFKTEPYTHEYPFCWRCGTPLLYYAKNSWFIRMSSLRSTLRENNRKVRWVPEHLQEGRFGEFLKEAKDWALSRERYWGTPLPVWRCRDENCGQTLVVGAYADFEKHRFRKKNEYFIVRHGLSTKLRDNGEELIASRLQDDNYDLTPAGMQRVAEHAARLKRDGGADLIFASPFLRAKRSGQVIGDTLGAPVAIDERLKELDHGSMCEGKPHAVCLQTDEVENFDIPRGDGESWRDVKFRMASFMREMEETHEGKRIVIVSHGDPLWILEGIASGRSETDMIASRKERYLTQGEVRPMTFPYLPRNEEGDIDPHRPHVDGIVLKCPGCSGQMRRVPDLIDVWFDSGAMPYAQWHYPFENRERVESSLFRKADSFPADFVAEAVDQTRGWFYTLLAISTALGKGAPYRNVLCHSHVTDEKGQKMSKSKGNVIAPDEVMDRVGADAARWYFYTVSHPGEPKSFSFKDAETKLNGFIGTLFNTLRFFELYAGEVRNELSPEMSAPRNLLDRWILSRLHRLVREATERLEAVDPTLAARELEAFVGDLSNWWLRRSRTRFQRPAGREEHIYVASFLRHLLLETVRLAAPFVPFAAEKVYRALRSERMPESVHLEDWPTASGGADDALERDMDELRRFVTLGLAQRKAKQLKVRQPLASVGLKRKESFASDLENLLKDELNVKEIRYVSAQEHDLTFDETLTPEMTREGYAREISRQIQDLRKEAGYELSRKVQGYWESENEEIRRTLEEFGGEISEDTLLVQFTEGRREADTQKESELGGGKLWLGVRK